MTRFQVFPLLRPTGEDLSPETKAQIRLHRLLSLLGALLVPLFGALHAAATPRAIGPTWARFALGGLFAALFGLSYLSEHIRRSYARWFRGAVYLVMGWVALVAGRSGFAGGYAADLLLVFGSLLVVVGSGARSIRAVLWFGGFGIAAAAGGLLLGPAPQTSPPLLLASMTAAALLVGLTLWAHLSVRERLRERGEQLRSITENVSEGIYRSVPGEGLVYANQAFAEMFGFESPEEIRQTDPVQLYVDSSERERLREKAREQGSFDAAEVEFRRKDGTRFTGLLSGTAVRGEAGTIKYYDGAVADITARKRAEEKLRKANRAFRTLSRANQALIRAESEKELLEEICAVIVEAGYRLAWVGYAERGEEKRVRPVAQSGYEKGYLDAVKIHWAEGERGRGPTGKAIRTGTPFICRNIMENPASKAWREDALERGYRSSAALPLRVDGDVIGALNVYATDVDAFEEDEVELLQELAGDLAYGIKSLRRKKEARIERRKFKNLTESLREIVYRADPETLGMTYVNDSVERVYGYAQQVWLEEPKLWKKSIHPDDRDRVLTKIEALQDRHASGTLEYRVVREDEKVRWVENHLSWERDEEGTVVSAIGIMYDVTERKEREQALRRAKEEAEEANRMKSAFLANMSHEIRTPLTSIIGFAEAIGEAVSGDEGIIFQFAGLIEESGRRLLETLNVVLQFSELEAGEMELSPEPVDVAAEAKETAAQFDSQARAANVRMEVEAKGPVWARAAEGGVQIVLRNLLSNAIKYTAEGGQVWVRVRADKDSVLVEVEDTGIGMDPEEVPQLFSPFRQASEGTSREYEGTGLGLAITRRVVEQMGGEVEVETEKGEGTCFTVRFPKAKGVEKNGRS